MIHSRTKIIALIALLLFVLSLAMYGGVVYVTNTHKAKLYDERLRVAEVGVQVRALNALEETVRESADDRKKLASFVLPKDTVIEFVSMIESKGRAPGVTFTTNELEEVAIDDTFGELKVNATIEGSFDGIMRTLHILEAIPLQSSLPQVTISRVSEDTWNASVVIHVTTSRI
jgi:hypothetical protein